MIVAAVNIVAKDILLFGSACVIAFCFLLNLLLTDFCWMFLPTLIYNDCVFQSEPHVCIIWKLMGILMK